MNKLADLIAKSKSTPKEEKENAIRNNTPAETTKPKKFGFGKPKEKIEDKKEKLQPVQSTEETKVESSPSVQIHNETLIGQPEIAGFTQEELEEWNTCFGILKDNINNKEMVGNAIRIVMTKIQEQERYREILAPDDIGLMVDGLRNSYGVALNIKQGKASKRAQKAKLVDDVAANLGDLEIKF